MFVEPSAARDAAEQIELFDACRALASTPSSRAVRLRLCRPSATVSSAVSQSTSLPLAALAHHRRFEAVGAVDAFVAEAVAVGDPGLVDRFVLARHHAHELAAQHVAEQVRADAVVRRDQRMRRHLPGARAEAERLGDERAHRAQVDDVAGQLVIARSARSLRADLHVLAAADHAELLEAGDLLGEAHAARAVDAARHVGGDQRAEVLVLHRRACAR